MTDFIFTWMSSSRVNINIANGTLDFFPSPEKPALQPVDPGNDSK